MRYGVLADIHGNLHALQAALEELRRCDVDGWLVAGDLVGYGPHPNECVELVAGLGGTCIAGNHDLIAPGGVAVAHGSIDDPQDYTVTPPQARAQLARLDADGARVLVLGHTHRPWAFTPGVG